ncbi:MAG: FkbM family methyltransferase [Acidobacteriia bacterium]|nr:FkbM family methyltransferase [Terriglobia bacterium]
MDFSGISDKSLAGKALRRPLRLLPPDTVLPILQGKLRGLKWIAGSSNHGCWLGSYEYHKRKAFEERVAKGSVVFDIGANTGFYTLLASVLVGPQGRVFAFEPVPRNLRYLQEHLRINGIKNVSVIEAAVADCVGVAHFDAGPNPSMGRLAADGCLTVRTVSLDEMVRRGELPPPDYMKIDVEGAELLVLTGATFLLENTRPTVFLATHGQDLHQQCCQLLESFGYQLRAIGDNNLERSDEMIALPSGWPSEGHDAGPMQLAYPQPRGV